MPLRAFIDSKEVISIEQDVEQWNNLKTQIKSKNAVVKLACCGQDGVPKTSNNGLNYFAHNKSNASCGCQPDSTEHLRAKIDIIEACKENGWKAVPEYHEANWRADVFATLGKNKIAFEVKWSKQAFDETVANQKQFDESGVRGCWFFKTVPKELRSHGNMVLADKNIPAFKISKDEDLTVSAYLNQTKLPLKSLVNTLLKRQLKFCDHVRLKPKQEVTIVFFETSCWQCHKPQHLWTVQQNFLTICNQHFHLPGAMWDDDDIDKTPEVYKAVKDFLQTEKGKDLKIGVLKRRYSNTTEHDYLSHGCFYCDALFGDFFVRVKKLDALNDLDGIIYTTEINFQVITEEQKHWCYSEHQQFCE